MRRACSRVYDTRWKRVRDLGCADREVYLDFPLRRVTCARCGVRNERLDFLAANTKYTLRFAMQIGGLCRSSGFDPRMTVLDVARLMRLDWDTVKDHDKIYMREQLRAAVPPKPGVIGVDEISIKKGHAYRIVVSDLEARRAIRFGGTGRLGADRDLFFAFPGKENSQNIKLAVMDMWKAFRNSTRKNAPQAAILFDKARPREGGGSTS